MKLQEIKKKVEEIGLEVDENLILYKDNREIGRIYQIEDTGQYSININLQGENIVSCTSYTNLEKLVQSRDIIRLGRDCNMPGKLAVVDEVKKWGVTCYIEDPTDENKRAEFKMKYGSFELTNIGKTMH